MAQNDRILKLAHLVPCSRDYGVDVISDLVLNALMFAGSALTADGITNLIYTHLGCAVPRDLVAEKIHHLNEKELITHVRGGYVLSHHVKARLAREREEFNALFDRVADRWLQSVSSAYTVNDTDAGLLVRDLWEYTNSLFLKHGVDSLNLIKGELSTELFGANKVPAEFHEDSAHLKDIERTEFPKFLGTDDPDTLSFLLALIDRAIRYLSSVVDPELLATLRVRLAGKILFLDSSTVYRLLNLQGAHRHEVVSTVVQLCKDAGFDLRVNRMTLLELRRRLEFDANVLRRYPIPTNLAAVGVKYLTEENYVSTYWYSARETGLSVEDFIDQYRHIDVLLTEMGIVVETEIRHLPPSAEKDVEFWVSQLNLFQQGREYTKSLPALEHDAYNIALIDSLGDPTGPFIDSPGWFFTTDQALIKFQNTNHHRKGLRPFAIMPSQLLQILRFTTSADGAYDRAFLGLFARSFIPTDDGLPNEMIQEILGRIAIYQGSPTLAERVLSDSFFRRKYQAAHDDGERDELVHDTLIEKAKELENNLNELKERHETLARDFSTLSEEAGRKDHQLRAVMDELEREQKLRREAEARERETQKRYRMLLGLIGLIAAAILFPAIPLIFYGGWSATPEWWRKVLGAWVSLIGGILPTGYLFLTDRWSSTSKWWRKGLVVWALLVPTVAIHYSFGEHTWSKVVEYLMFLLMIVQTLAGLL